MNKKPIYIVLALILVALVFIGAKPRDVPASSIPVAASAVRINIGDSGTCSGVHIGGGYILTAGHCTVSGKPLEIENSNGGKAPARLMWANVLNKGGYDIALLKIDNPLFSRYLDKSEVACERPAVGTEVMMYGNPLGMYFVQTRGTIASKEVQQTPPWRKTMVIDGAGGAGMSGGPVIRVSDGKVVGLVVAGIGQVSPFILMAPMWGGGCELLAMAD